MVKRQWLHEAAKFCAGLIAADFISLWWLSMQNTTQYTFLGLSLTNDGAVAGMIVDIFLFIMLVHYAWNIGQIPRMKERMYLTVAGIIFSLVAIAHLIRIFSAGEVVIFGWYVPIFLSWLGVVAATYLAYSSFHFAGRMKR